MLHVVCVRVCNRITTLYSWQQVPALAVAGPWCLWVGPDVAEVAGQKVGGSLLRQLSSKVQKFESRGYIRHLST